ncbi:hypothetical protein ACFV5J_13135 [Streptomyces zaomyceticus]|uniref:hypothetical protein n=1 Tax=Streptomyces zaomyceticus TaxID=68286 RepID=UPI0036460A73
MMHNDVEHIGWELTGWEDDDNAAHTSSLSRAEVLRIKELFPERGDDDLLATAVYPVAPELYAAICTAVPHVEFAPGLDYMLGGFRLS